MTLGNNAADAAVGHCSVDRKENVFKQNFDYRNECFELDEQSLNHCRNQYANTSVIQTPFPERVINAGWIA